MAYFYIVDGKVTVWDVGDLLEILAAASHLEQVFPIQQGITLLGHGELPDGRQLVGEKGLTTSTKIHRA